ncbi:MAG TPA: DUF4136 domain-containing protein [Acidobacteriaceae bacterium]
MKHFARLVAAVLFGVATAGAPILAQTVTIDYDHTVNFAKFKTYTWNKVHATDPTVENRITLALNRDIAGRYMTEVAKGGDVTIAAVEATRDKDEYTTFYTSLGDFMWQRGWGSAGFMDSQAALQDIPVDTLVIDMYDTKSYKLLWRGTITLSASEAANKEADQKIDKAVTQLIGKYPPKFKK